MGCGVSTAPTATLGAPLPGKATGGVDPRWDDAGFNAWATETQVQFVLVKYLRDLHAQRRVLPAGQWIPRDAYHIGAPPSGAEVFTVLHRWLSREHPDPHGEHLADLIALLEDADDSDLVLMDFISIPRIHYSLNGDGSFADFVGGDTRLRAAGSPPRLTDLSPEDWRRGQAWDHGLRTSAWHVAYSALRTVVLHRDDCRNRGIHESIWLSAELMLAAYCQRIVNASDPELQQHFSPEQLVNPVGRLREGHRSGAMKIAEPWEVEENIIPMLVRSMSSMAPVFEDHVGFECFCARARIGWIKVAYVRSFVAAFGSLAEGGAPCLFPRRQELPRGSFYEGLPPIGARRFVVSHGWACEHHPTPGAEKIRRLAQSLAGAGARDADAVFLDYASLYQRGRPALGAALGVPAQRGWTLEESRCFRTALFEMSRMYAFGGCEVLVLPQPEPWQCFPGGAGAQPTSAYSEVKKRDCEWSPMWGWINDVPYQNRGWCCAEFSCALKAGVISNLADPDVQSVLKSRRWPATVAEYKAMMEETSASGRDVVEFTAKGDREYVAYLFLKMSFDVKSLMA